MSNVTTKTFGKLKMLECNTKKENEFYFELNCTDMTFSYRGDSNTNILNCYSYKQVYNFKFHIEDSKKLGLKIDLYRGETIILFFNDKKHLYTWSNAFKEYFDKKMGLIKKSQFKFQNNLEKFLSQYLEKNDNLYVANITINRFINTEAFKEFINRTLKKLLKNKIVEELLTIYKFYSDFKFHKDFDKIYKDIIKDFEFYMSDLDPTPRKKVQKELDNSVLDRTLNISDIIERKFIKPIDTKQVTIIYQKKDQRPTFNKQELSMKAEPPKEETHGVYEFIYNTLLDLVYNLPIKPVLTTTYQNKKPTVPTTRRTSGFSKFPNQYNIRSDKKNHIHHHDVPLNFEVSNEIIKLNNIIDNFK
jgi:hypothetical protein